MDIISVDKKFIKDSMEPTLEFLSLLDAKALGSTKYPVIYITNKITGETEKIVARYYYHYVDKDCIDNGFFDEFAEYLNKIINENNYKSIILRERLEVSFLFETGEKRALIRLIMGNFAKSDIIGFGYPDRIVSHAGALKEISIDSFTS